MDHFSLTLAEGETLLDQLLKDGIAIAHDCGGTLACASCRVVVVEGLERLNTASEDELDMLDRANAAAPGARLACQAEGAGDVVIATPQLAPLPEAVPAALIITERAAQHLARQLAKQPGARAVRVTVQPAGCSGFGYRVDGADAIGKDDAVFEAHGVRVVVDGVSLGYLNGSTLDVVQEGLARRVRFDNPNARQTCGCGESFGL
jgi:iron-sulfur cluster assembly protein